MESAKAFEQSLGSVQLTERLVLAVRGAVVIIAVGITGCAVRQPGPKPVSQAEISLPSASKAQTQTLSDDEISTIIQDRLRLLQLKREDDFCAARRAPVRGSTSGNQRPIGFGNPGSTVPCTPPPTPTGSEPSVTGCPGSIYQPAGQENDYLIWLEYVAEHIKTNTVFGPDYEQVAAGALDVTGVTDVTGDRCLNRRPRDTDEQQQINQVDPAAIGRQLFSNFTQYDQPTRDRAAKVLLE